MVAASTLKGYIERCNVSVKLDVSYINSMSLL